MDSPDDILAPVRDRLRQQQAAIRSAQALADHWQGVANQQRAEIDQLRSIHAAALAWRTAISVPDGVQAAEARMLAALERIDREERP